MAGFGQFGGTLKSLERSQFFKWFSFEAVDGGAYRPSGEAFRDLVSLETQRDGETVTALSLAVRRGFIEDPQQGAFARDLVKSFLLGLAGGHRAVASLADEIFFRDPVGVVLMRGGPPGLPAEPSAAYRVFRGEAQAWETQVGGLKLTFSNRGEGADAQFVALAELVPAKGWFARLLGR